MKKLLIWMLIIVVVLTGIYIWLHTYTITIKYYAPCWSPDGKKIAFFMEKKVLKTYHYRIAADTDELSTDLWLCTMDYDGKNMKRIAKMPGNDPIWKGYQAYIDWHKGGKMAFTICSGGLYIYDQGNGQINKVLEGSDEGGYPQHPSFSPDGLEIIYSFEDSINSWNTGEKEGTRELWIYDTKNDKKTKIAENAQEPIWNPIQENLISFNEIPVKQGKREVKGVEVDYYYYHSPNPAILLKIDAKDRKKISDFSIQQWSPDGKWLIYSGGSEKINIETGEERVVSKDGGGIISPDERMSVGSAPDTGIEVYWTDKNPRDEDAEILYKSARIFKSHFKWWVKIQCKIQENI